MKNVFAFLSLLLFSLSSFAEEEIDTLSYATYKRIDELTKKSFSANEIVDSLKIETSFHKELVNALIDYKNLEYLSSLSHLLSCTENVNQQYNSEIKAELYFYTAACYSSADAMELSLKYINLAEKTVPNKINAFNIHYARSLYLIKNKQYVESQKEFNLSLEKSLTLRDSLLAIYNLISQQETLSEELNNYLTLAIDKRNVLKVKLDSILFLGCLNNRVEYLIEKKIISKADSLSKTLNSWNIENFPYQFQASTALNKFKIALSKNENVDEVFKQIINLSNEDKKSLRLMYDSYLLLVDVNFPSLSKSMIKDSIENYVNKILENKTFEQNKLTKLYSTLLESNLELSNKELKAQEEKTKFFKLIIVISTILGALIIFTLWKSYSNYKSNAQKKEELLKAKNELTSAELEKKKLESLINKDKIIQREKDMHHLQDVIKSKIDLSNNVINEINAIVNDDVNDTKGSLKNLIVSLSSFDAAEKEIRELSDDENLYNTRFQDKLKELHGDILSNTEIQMCCLFNLGFDSKTIARIRNISYDSIRTIKSRIKKKLPCEDFPKLEQYLEKVSKSNI